MRTMRIAVIGSRGVPATFGGIEHHVEEIESRLAARGHDVTVYCRSNYVPAGLAEHRGMKIRRLPVIRTKYFDAVAHSSLSTVDALTRRFDIVHFHALGPGLPALLPRALHTSKVVQTVHGLDYERAKWGRVAKTVLRTGGWLSARVPDATIVVSQSLQDYYAQHYGRPTSFITNGAVPPVCRPARRIVDELGLQPRRYVLSVGRLVPEKATDLLIAAFAQVPGDFQLVVAGGSSFTDDYVAYLRELAAADPRVKMVGFVYGDLLEELYNNAAVFCLPSLVEGLPLTLLEASSYARPVIASAISPHVEVLREDGPGHRLVSVDDQAALARSLTAVLADLPGEEAGGPALQHRVMANHNWDAVADATEEVYRRVLAGGRRHARKWSGAVAPASEVLGQ